jgi:hypothetical protein
MDCCGSQVLSCTDEARMLMDLVTPSRGMFLKSSWMVDLFHC